MNDKTFITSNEIETYNMTKNICCWLWWINGGNNRIADHGLKKVKKNKKKKEKGKKKAESNCRLKA